MRALFDGGCSLSLLAVCLLTVAGCETEASFVAGEGLEASNDDVAATPRGDGGRTASSDWPKWRGPLADGIARNNKWRKNWDEQPPTVAWKTNVGIGFGSMAVVDGRLYVMGHNGEKDEGRGEETVYCLDAATGEEVWKHSYPGPLLDKQHEGGPGATPTVVGKRVFTHGRDSQLYCLDAATGERLWSKMLKEEFDVEQPTWAFSCSPLPLGDGVILDIGRVVALDQATGKTLWATGKFQAGYGTPAAFKGPDGPRLAVLNNDYLIVLEAKDGSEIARTAWETQYDTNATTPIVESDRIYISTGYNKGCLLARLEDGKLEWVYDNKEMRNHMANCVLIDGYLYGVDGNSHSSRNCNLVCQNFETGDAMWKERGYGCGTVLAADGMLIVLSDEGRLVLAPVDPKRFEPIAEVRVLTGKCWTVPVLAGGRIYCRNATGDMVCLDVR